MFPSLNQLNNGVLTRTADQGMNDEMMIILTHTDATNTQYIIRDLEHIEFRTSSGQRLTLRRDDFYLGCDVSHIAGTADRIAIVDNKIDLLGNNILLSSRDGNITITNISTAPEDINTVVGKNADRFQSTRTA
jgi:hypothetical protein